MKKIISISFLAFIFVSVIGIKSLSADEVQYKTQGQTNGLTQYRYEITNDSINNIQDFPYENIEDPDQYADFLLDYFDEQ